MKTMLEQFSRRKFIGAGAVASAASLTGFALSPPAMNRPSSPSKLRISVLCYSFRGLLKEGKMDIFGYLESCKYRYGLDAADIWNGFLTSTDEAYLKKIREALDERELASADLCTDGT